MNRKRSVVKQMYRWSLVSAAALLMAVVCLGQAAPEKKSYTFHGKVEVVNESDNSLQVNNEKIEGWMVAMSMVYSVDDPAIHKEVKGRRSDCGNGLRRRLRHPSQSAGRAETDRRLKIQK